jgi:hypothetical protein
VTKTNCRLLTLLMPAIVDRLPNFGIVMWLRGGGL